MKEQCAVAAAMSAVALAGGEEGCPVVAHIEKCSAREFHIRTEDASGKRILGFCKNDWVSQSVTVD